jgi:putative toxin-antitoxin system antitoxin component (TIGR02293 family)
MLETVTIKAIDVLGSQEAAIRWLATPAIALDGQRPIDLLSDPEGVARVLTLLVRMDYGIYA